MAHYKKKRPRTNPAGYYSANALKHRLGEKYDDHAWSSNWPRYWDKIFHIRPARRKNRQLEHSILRGADPDNMVWPDDRKPHIYYW
jgi:hypothetical protein